MVYTREIVIRTFGNQCSTETLNKVKLSVRTLSNSHVTVECYVKDICADLTGQYINFAKQSYKHLTGLKLADFNDTDNLEVDLLIGADHYWSFIENEVVRGEHGPIALRTKLGYVLSGISSNPISDNGCSVMTSHVLKVASEYKDMSLNKKLKRFLGDWTSIQNLHLLLNYSEIK